jgi:hypothetical protein
MAIVAGLLCLLVAGDVQGELNESKNSTIPQTDDIQEENLIAEESLKADGLTGPIVALRSSKNGKYVRLDDEDLSADSTSVTDSEKFCLINVDGGVALKSVLSGGYVCNPKYLCGSDDIKCPAIWDDYYGDGLNPAGLYQLEYNSSGGWSFLARNGKYLCADEYDLIKANKYNKGSWETFRLELQDEPKLQDQINAASTGGTVNLKEGVYKGTATIDKSVDIIGASTGGTVLDGGRQGSVFAVGKSDPNIDVRLSAITIIGGSGEDGGGISNFGRLTLDEIVISRNTASNSGGGLFNHGDTNCVAVRVSNNSAGSGAGIFNDAGSHLALSNVEIKYNKATTRGGGILNKGDMLIKWGIVCWDNKPDNMVDAPDLGPPAGNSADSLRALADKPDVCGKNNWSCPGTCDTSPNTKTCRICAVTNPSAWSNTLNACMSIKHYCCKDENYNCACTDTHGCTVCKCGRKC